MDDDVADDDLVWVVGEWRGGLRSANARSIGAEKIDWIVRAMDERTNGWMGHE